jgi:hypothetical protein
MVFRIKTKNAFLERNSQEGRAKVVHCKMNLVGGNVTAGGGKATTTKTYWHQVLRGTKQNEFIQFGC